MWSDGKLGKLSIIILVLKFASYRPFGSLASVLWEGCAWGVYFSITLVLLCAALCPSVRICRREWPPGCSCQNTHPLMQTCPQTLSLFYFPCPGTSSFLVEFMERMTEKWESWEKRKALINDPLKGLNSFFFLFTWLLMLRSVLELYKQVLIYSADTDMFVSDEHVRRDINVWVLFIVEVCETVRLSGGCQCDEPRGETPYEAVERSAADFSV